MIIDAKKLRVENAATQWQEIGFPPTKEKYSKGKYISFFI